jgi:fatty-acyl-CoA synthase
MSGATMVMPGAKLDGASVYDIIESNGVTCSAAVPTVWLNLLSYLEQTGKPLSKLKRVFIGGSACPRAIIEAFEVRYGVNVVHAWGMTEMSPVGAVCSIKPSLGHLNGVTLYDLKMKQGHAHFTVEMKIESDDGEELPWDGKTFGRLKVRGPTVIKGYFRGDGGEVIDADGFFDTGDIATIDPSGYMQITDRAKDVIKSGGEWISSIDLENLAVGHPEVAEAAVIGVVHPKWDERPLLVVVPKTGMNPTRESILAFMEGKIARWWMPDDVVFVPEIPHTATGKIHKTTLREQFKDFRFSVSS